MTLKLLLGHVIPRKWLKNLILIFNQSPRKDVLNHGPSTINHFPNNADLEIADETVDDVAEQRLMHIWFVYGFKKCLSDQGNFYFHHWNWRSFDIWNYGSLKSTSQPLVIKENEKFKKAHNGPFSSTWERLQSCVQWKQVMLSRSQLTGVQ